MPPGAGERCGAWCRRRASRRRTRRSCPCRGRRRRRATGLAAAAGQDALRRRSCRAGRRGWSRGGPGSPSRPSAPTRPRCTESNTTLPTAAPGEALTPLAILRAVGASSSKRGNISWASCAPVTRCSASSMSIRPSSTSWVAMRNAAAGGALADPGLQHPELAALDGELDVAQVAVVVLELCHDRDQLVVGRLVDALEVGQRHGVADAGDDVLALRVLQVVAVDALGAGAPGRG